LLKGLRSTELLRLFLKLGVTSFGGPAVPIANMHTECVVKPKWLTPDEFLDLMAILPGTFGMNSAG
jgi:chromate transporter